MAGPPTHEAFEPYIDQEFRFGDHPQPLRLSQIDVKDRPPLPGLDYKAFMLIFSGPRSGVMPEGTYSVEAPGGGRFELYVIPIHTPANDRQDYQVVFN
ncbi:MAG TPA: hypothetical protein VMI56_18070 [Reyranella sp.]|nr:hypothetical protein [Reyranella sp.]